MPSSRTDSALRAWTLFSPIVLFLVGFSAFRQSQNAKFTVLDVERINVREKDGTLRLAISNQARSPAPADHGVAWYGKGGNRAGLIFYNEEGTENGGLIFGGKREANGKYSAGAGLTFDQYDSDQIIALQYQENNGERYQGLAFWDRPEIPIRELVTERQRIDSMPEGSAKTIALDAWKTKQGGLDFSAARLFVGRTRSKASLVQLYDRSGKVRLKLSVDSLGKPTLAFMDDSGRVVYDLPDSALVARQKR
ncbi:MAG TPA: hypothetical protein VGO33_05905 [Gemmatimonadaceae bacterium]|nr:hypothetical protein [Gemmatimonadaceae bacterium]